MIAPMVLGGPMTGEWFLGNTQQVRAPTLKPCDIAILDNLLAHKGPRCAKPLKHGCLAGLED